MGPRLSRLQPDAWVAGEEDKAQDRSPHPRTQLWCLSHGRPALPRFMSAEEVYIVTNVPSAPGHPHLLGQEVRGPAPDHRHLPVTALNHVSLQSGRAIGPSNFHHICTGRSLIRLMAFARLHALGPAFRESRNPTGQGGKPLPQQPGPNLLSLRKYMNQASFFHHQLLAGPGLRPPPPRPPTHTPLPSLGSGGISRPQISPAGEGGSC